MTGRAPQWFPDRWTQLPLPRLFDDEADPPTPDVGCRPCNYTCATPSGKEGHLARSPTESRAAGRTALAPKGAPWRG